MRTLRLLALGLLALIFGSLAGQLSSVRAGQVGVVQIPEQALKDIVQVTRGKQDSVTFSSESGKAVLTVPESGDSYRFFGLDADGKELGEIQSMPFGEGTMVLLPQMFKDSANLRQIRVETQSAAEKAKVASIALAKMKKLAEGDKKDKIGALLPYLSTDKLSADDLKMLRDALHGKGGKSWVFLDFWGEWCHGCLLLHPEIRAITTEFSGKLTVGSVDLTRSIGMPFSTTEKPEGHPEWVEIVGPTDEFSEDWWQMVVGMSSRSIPYLVLISPDGAVFELKQQSLRAQIEKHLGDTK